MSKQNIITNNFFTDKFVLASKYAGVGSMEDYYVEKVG